MAEEKWKLLGEWGVNNNGEENNNMGNDDDMRGIEIGVNWGRLMSRRYDVS